MFDKKTYYSAIQSIVVYLKSARIQFFIRLYVPFYTSSSYCPHDALLGRHDALLGRHDVLLGRHDAPKGRHNAHIKPIQTEQKLI